MSILIISTGKDPKPWQESLQRVLPEVDIFIHPDYPKSLCNPFVVAWNPTAEQLAEIPPSEVLQSLGAGVDRLLQIASDLPWSPRIARIVDQTLCRDLWQYCLATVMSHLRQLPQYQKDQAKRRWLPRKYSRIQETRVAVLGLGQIGAFVAEQFALLGFTVSGWSRSPKQIHGVNTFTGGKQLSLALAKCEVIINCLPLTKDTRGLLNKTTLLNLEGALMINVGRGNHVNEKDLLDLLDGGQLAAAFLDVFTSEPLPRDHPFWEHERICITPHIAAITKIESTIEQIAENYRRFATGEPLLNEVDPQRGY